MPIFRQILSEKLTNQQKTTLREFFNTENGKAYKRISQISNFMGYDNSDDTYEQIRDLYNDYVLEQQRIQRNTRDRFNRAAAKVAKQEHQDRRNLLADFKYIKPIDFDSEEFNNNVLPKLYDIAKKLVGKNIVYIQSSYDGTMVKQSLVEIKSKNFMSIYYDNLRPFFETYENGELINYFDTAVNYVRIVVFDVDTVIPERLQQKFLDGEKHCVIEPIRNIFQQYLANSFGKESQRKFTRTINKLNQFETC